MAKKLGIFDFGTLFVPETNLVVPEMLVVGSSDRLLCAFVASEDEPDFDWSKAVALSKTGCFCSHFVANARYAQDRCRMVRNFAALVVSHHVCDEVFFVSHRELPGFPVRQFASMSEVMKFLGD